MARIKKTAPRKWRGPVEITPDHYEVWMYAPSKLGDIHKRGAYWVTTDGMRFGNSQDASEYYMRKSQGQVQSSPVVRKETVPTPRVESSKLGGTTAREKLTPVLASTPSKVRKTAGDTDLLRNALDMIAKLEKELRSGRDN